jgi:branched-chain amino acid transport system substrate-binding protein
VSANLHESALPMLLPTNTINTTVSDFRPIKQMQMVKFDGQKWELFGEVMSEAR